MGEDVHKAEDDVRLLREFGYEQALYRAVGWGRSAMVNISTSSVTTAVVSLFAFGLLTAGTSMLWYWLAGFGVAMLITLAFAELGSSLPIAGALYQWNSRIVSPAYGWLTGWLYVAAQIAICAAVAYAIPPLVAALFGWNLTTDRQIAETVAILWLSVAINVAGIVFTTSVATIGVFAELLGMVGMTILLFVHGFNQPITSVFHMNGVAAGSSFVSVALIAILFGSWAYTGLEMPTDIAEETRDARHAIPRAAITSLATTGIVGFLFLLAITWAIPNIGVALAAPNPLQAIIEGTFNTAVWDAFAATVIVAIFVALVTNMTLTSRIIFSIARDEKFPIHPHFGFVPARTKTPAAAIVLVGVIASALAFWTSSIAVLAAACLSALFFAYQMVLWPVFWKRMRGDWQPTGPWQLRQWALPVYIGAIVLGTGALVDISWPRTSGIPWWQNWMAVLFVIVSFATAGAYYAFRRTAIDRPLPYDTDVPETKSLIGEPAPEGYSF